MKRRKRDVADFIFHMSKCQTYHTFYMHNIFEKNTHNQYKNILDNFTFLMTDSNIRNVRNGFSIVYGIVKSNLYQNHFWTHISNFNLTSYIT